MERTAITGHKHGRVQLTWFNDTLITCSFNYSRRPGSPDAKPRGFAFPGQHRL